MLLYNQFPISGLVNSPTTLCIGSQNLSNSDPSKNANVVLSGLKSPSGSRPSTNSPPFFNMLSEILHGPDCLTVLPNFSSGLASIQRSNHSPLTRSVLHSVPALFIITQLVYSGAGVGRLGAHRQGSVHMPWHENPGQLAGVGLLSPSTVWVTESNSTCLLMESHQTTLRRFVLSKHLPGCE